MKMRFSSNAECKSTGEVMNSFISGLFERIVSEASNLMKVSKNKTMTSKEIQSAIKLLMPGELAKHSI